MKPIRINKYLSMCGVTSRRGAETLVADGRVTINDETVTKVGSVVNLETDTVKVDGSEVRPVEEAVYVLLNKPKMVMTTLHDPFKRRTVAQLLDSLVHRVYPVGRLDYDTSGVLLLTNDGDLAFRLSHPKYEVEKVYEALVRGRFEFESKQKIEAGIKLEDGAIGNAKVDILGYRRAETKLRLVLKEGRKREVKQLCKSVGHPVQSLRRVEFAGLTAKGLNPGSWRILKHGEIVALKKLVGLPIE